MLAIVALLAGAGVLCAYRSVQAVKAGRTGKAALLRGEANLSASKLAETETDLTADRDSCVRITVYGPTGATLDPSSDPPARRS